MGGILLVKEDSYYSIFLYKGRIYCHCLVFPESDISLPGTQQSWTIFPPTSDVIFLATGVIRRKKQENKKS